MGKQATDRQKKISELREKMLKKQQISEGIPTELWIVDCNYDNNKVTINSVSVKEAKKGPMRMTPFTESTRYCLDKSPFEVDIYDGEMSSKDEGHGSGFGDLHAWTHYAFLNKVDAEEQFVNSSHELVERRINKLGVLDYFASALYNEAEKKAGFECGVKWDILADEKKQGCRSIVTSAFNEWKEDEVIAAKLRENIEIECTLNNIK